MHTLSLLRRQRGLITSRSFIIARRMRAFDHPERLVEMLCDFRLGHRGKEREFDYLAQVLRELLNRLAYQLARLHRRDRIEGTLASEWLENFRLALHVVLEPICGALSDPFQKLDLGFAFFDLIGSRRPSAKQNELLRYSVTR